MLAISTPRPGLQQRTAHLGDAAIRSALRLWLHQEHVRNPETVIIEELGLCRGQVRVDVAVVDDQLHGYEIKSDRDTLDRIATQIAVYGKVLDRATLVTGDRFTKFAPDLVPRWWGLLHARPIRKRLEFRLVRRGKKNPQKDPRALVELLWSDHAIRLLEQRNAARGVRGKARRFVWARVCEYFDVEEIAEEVRAALNFAATLDLVAYQMGCAVFAPFVTGEQPLSMTLAETSNTPVGSPEQMADFEETSPALKVLAEQRNELPLDWIRENDPAERFAAFTRLPLARRKQLFTAAAARALRPQLAFEHGAHPETEAIVARLDVPFARIWRPDMRYWKRMQKREMLAIATRVLGADWAGAHAKDKKGDLAAAMNDAFGADTPAAAAGLTGKAREAALAWMPKGFAAFDAGAADETPEAAGGKRSAPRNRSNAKTDPGPDALDGANEVRETVAPPANGSTPGENGSASRDDGNTTPKPDDQGQDDHSPAAV